MKKTKPNRPTQSPTTATGNDPEKSGSIHPDNPVTREDWLFTENLPGTVSTRLAVEWVDRPCMLPADVLRFYCMIWTLESIM